MNQTQKIIKYFALAFAFFLIVNILICGMYGLKLLSSFTNDISEDADKTTSLNIDEDLSVIDIDLLATNLYIKKGSTLKAATNNDKIVIEQKNNQLIIKEKKENRFNFDDKESLTVYIPDYLYDQVLINAGAGKVKIEQLKAKQFYLDLGAGNVIIDKIEITKKTIINSGAGKLEIKDGKLSNLDLDLGVGRAQITAKVTGNSKLDAGVGEIVVNLVGTKEDYQIVANKGIGDIKLEQQEMVEDNYYGTGNNKIDINGGVGSIKLDFVK